MGQFFCGGMAKIVLGGDIAKYFGSGVGKKNLGVGFQKKLFGVRLQNILEWSGKNLDQLKQKWWLHTVGQTF